MGEGVDIKAETKKGAIWTTASSLIASACQLGLTIILSRYLTHNDFGLFALVLFVVNFSQMFVDIGISNAIIHKQGITKRELDSLFWLNILMGITIFLLIFSCSGIISNFYNSPSLKHLLVVISFTFLIQPFGTQFSVLLRKELKFKSLAIRTILAQIGSFMIGIYLAVKGYGVYSLVYSNMLNVTIGTLLLILEGLKIHRPRFYFSLIDVKPYLAFGTYQLGEKIMNFLNSDADTLIIGRFVGVEALGIYSVAKNLISKPYQVINPILTKIGFPLMAKVQNDNEVLQKFYAGIVRVLSFLNFPIHLFVFVFPSEVVEVVLGKEWLEAVFPLRILALCYLLRSTMNPIGSLQLAKGKADYGFYWNLIQFLALPAIIYISSFWGINLVCLAITAFQLLMFSIIGKVMVNRLCDLDVTKYYMLFLKPLIYSIGAILVSFVLTREIKVQSEFVPFLLKGLVFLVFYLILVFSFDRKILKEWFVR